MAVRQAVETDESVVPEALRRFLWRRTYELSGLALTTIILTLAVALATWSADDPSLNHATGIRAGNWLGSTGAIIADLLMQPLGLACIAFVFVPLTWAASLFRHEKLSNWKSQLLFWLLASFAVSGLLSTLPKPASWGLASGLGGYAGEIMTAAIFSLLAFVVKGALAQIIVFALALTAVILTLPRAIGFELSDLLQVMKTLGQTTRKLPLRAATGNVKSGLWSTAVLIFGFFYKRTKAKAPSPEPVIIDGDNLGRFRPLSLKRASQGFDTPEVEEPSEDIADEGEQEEEEIVAKPVRKATKIAPRTKPKKLRFELPDLDLLATPRKIGRGQELSKEQLEENARELESVLDDFGVKGQIIAVRPGPVVTLYELEPAPGIKSSRVISLADDIARSMSAISARVAVVSGRNAIGIELPNAKRETVYLRELFEDETFAKDDTTLNFALGKNIGGDPIFANLARMPHLLIAGTTGSGKSVGINTMILSLLYRLPPDKCKMIMIDPKMLELSVYEGIPHLLAPVVTDPRKAVVALKWAVREMEDRYRKMSKCGVRNIDGYNAKIAQLSVKGEKLQRTVQTGFDTNTGEAIFEQEEMDLQAMPYIVVIIDEMADLMMVAGKDIEGAVQRLAQMARAAGIHVVMATQRPSVDVITGTIKANFPTRISFQVTSKIDSRTILGEMGAEQLLGQGDMLYMAGGGRISRLHGPFVSDGEVEAIVNHLKAQGQPEYLDEVTEEQEEVGGEGGSMAGAEGGTGDDLYDQAVQVVLRDKKVSTSYVQRRLGIGYNKAATLIERMEQQGVISSPNGQGKREILVPGDSSRD